MDSVLVVVYSMTGTSRLLAERLCSQQGWPMGLLTDRHPRRGPGGMLRCVLDSLLQRCPAVRYDGPPPEDFHTVILIAPIWVYRLAAPMRSFIAEHRDGLHRAAVMVTMGSGGALNAFQEVERRLHRAPVLTCAFKAADVLAGHSDALALDFAATLRGTPSGPWGPLRSEALHAAGH
ncbi:flavodoxin family protein [Ramlibacter rhizophilus]|uniref:Flavodoxin n=1 Tax=Ramlibacter rhizophilus TaxID=1781167 RepID=A0A4Z0C186_9BURK|nr:flavodoxin [Ramlibacter rhizophilus]TFZ04981.1 flavodoxin [Ramlibacter rhizophilus]